MGVGYLTGQGGGSSNIKSYQEIYISSIDGNQDYTINAVDVNSTIVLIDVISENSRYDWTEFAVELINATTVNVRNYAQNTSTDKILVKIIEFKNVKTKQTGVYTAGSYLTFKNITITPVNIQKSVVFTSHYTSSTTTSNGGRYSSVISRLSASDNLQLMGDISMTIKWQVIEFK